MKRGGNGWEVGRGVLYGGGGGNAAHEGGTIRPGGTGCPGESAAPLLLELLQEVWHELLELAMPLQHDQVQVAQCHLRGSQLWEFCTARATAARIHRSRAQAAIVVGPADPDVCVQRTNNPFLIFPSVVALYTSSWVSPPHREVRG